MVSLTFVTIRISIKPEPSFGFVLHDPFGTHTHVCCVVAPGCVGKVPMPDGRAAPGSVGGNVGNGGRAPGGGNGDATPGAVIGTGIGAI